MSALIRDIREGFKGPVTNKFVLITLATYADKTGLAWPGQPRLAEDVGISARHLRTILGRLVASGWLVVLHRGDGRGKSTRYHIGKPIIKAEVEFHLSDSTKAELESRLSDGTDAVKAELGRTERRNWRAVKAELASSTELLEQSLNNHIRAVANAPAVSARSVKRRKQTTTKTPWPEGLVLTEKMRTDALGIARELGFTLDPEAEFEAWQDDCLANADKRRYSDWGAAWRNRIRLKPTFDRQSRGVAEAAPALRTVQVQSFEDFKKKKGLA